MRRNTVRAALLLAGVLLTMLIAPMMAGAVDNSDCLTCHGTSSGWAQDFSVAPVDRGTACRKCHLDRYAGTHPYHNAGGNCGVCHQSMGPSLLANVPTGAYAYGAFASAASGETSASLLHLIHGKSRWPAGTEKGATQCASCHGVVACDACHAAPLVSAHNSHGDEPTSAPVGTWVGDVSPGVVAGNDYLDTMQVGRELKCGYSGCHDIAGLALNTPYYYEDHNTIAYPNDGYPYPTSVTTSATWKPVMGGAYAKGGASLSNVANNALKLSFTGQRVAVMSDLDPYRGQADIIIDGVKVATVDFYSPVTKYQQIAFTSDSLGPGNHWIQVRVRNTKNTDARGTYVLIDSFKIWPSSKTSISPKCESCHDSSHAGASGSFSHDASQTITGANQYNTGYGNYACNKCHVSPMGTEHRRATSAGTGSCSTCHPIYAPTTWSGAWNSASGCTYGSCHTVAPRVPHSSVAASHAVPALRADNACRDCHGADLRPVHANSISGNGYLESDGCLACHSTTTLASSRSCTTPTCHVASGKTSLTEHGYDVARHTVPAGRWTSAYQGSGADGAVAAGGKECSACHTSALSSAHSEAPTVGCDSGGAGGDGCHLDTTRDSMAIAKAGWTAEKCTDCHDYGTSRTHEDTVTPHVVQAGTCAGTGSSCHADTDLWVIHSKSQSGSAPKYNSCSDNDPTDASGCHSMVNKRPAPVSFANSCGSTSTNCHTNVAIGTHPSGKHTIDLPNSNYNNLTQIGCTNSGAGCHGSSTTTNVADYHPNNGCTGGLCHNSADKPAAHQPFLCTDCHDATYENAPVNAPLDGASPSAGHYGETTHTATGMSGTVSAGGTYSAACSDCHNPVNPGGVDGLHAQHQGLPGLGSTTCSDCHNKNAAIQAIVTDAVRTNTCAACHTAAVLPTMVQHGATAPVVNGSEFAGGSAAPGTCVKGGCHATTDLHALHKSNNGGGANGCAMAGCHDTSQQAFRPTAKSCGVGGSCHILQVNHKHDLDAATSAGCYNSGAGCHVSTADDYASDDYHPANGCVSGACHAAANRDNTLYDNPNGCIDCHDGTYDGAPRTSPLLGVWPAGHYSETTHTAANLDEWVSANGSAKARCSDCHDPSVGGAQLGLRNQHTNVTIAGSPYGTSLDCEECHNDVRSSGQTEVFAGWTNNRCDDCHKVGGSSPITHAAKAPAVNATSSLGCGAKGKNCHSTYDLHEIHKNEAGCSLVDSGGQKCHEFGQQAKLPTAKSCGTGDACHANYTTNTSFPTHTKSAETTDHAPGNAVQADSLAYGSIACNACHVVKKADGGLVAEHSLGTADKTTNATNVCLNCHNNTSVEVSQTIMGGGWDANKDTESGCVQCHPTAVNRHTNWAVAGHTATPNTTCGNSGAGCHPVTNYTSTGVPTTTSGLHTGCLRCHDRTGSATAVAPGGGNMKYNPSNTTCGQGGNCHSTAGAVYPVSGDPVHRSGQTSATTGDDSAHHTGIAANKTNYPDTAAGVYSDAQACGGCHANTLKTAHSVTSTNGGAVTCLECHNGSGAITSPTASAVVKANWSNDKCTDCHAGASTHASFKSGAGYSANHAGTAQAGCAGSGNGCHGTSTSGAAISPSLELAQLHPTKGCNATSGVSGTSCHAVQKPMTSIGKSCGSAGGNCHGTYATKTHNTVTTGNESASHQATASAMSVKVYSGTYDLGGGETCSTCHSPGLVTAHKETSTTAGLDSGNSAWTNATICTDCHNAMSPDNSVAVVKASWPTKSCLACHGSVQGTDYHVGYSVAASHTAGTGTAATADSCGDAGCHNTLDTRAIHNKAGRGCASAGADSKGSNSACHALDKAMNKATEMKCGSGSGGCHTNHTDTNHGVDHDYTAASDYSESTSETVGGEAGCAASGGGCHPSATTGNAINTFHANKTAGCNTSDKCHASPTMTQAWKDGGSAADCSRCHAGNFTNARDAMPLWQASSAGHYNETTHTATGMGSTINAGGSRTAACSVCHSTMLRDAHGAAAGGFKSTSKGNYVTCTECHGYSAAVSSITTDAVRTDTCAACHAAGVLGASHAVHGNAPVTPATSSTGCASTSIGCHNTGDLHALHKNASSCALSGCHAPNKDMSTASTTCGGASGCHLGTAYMASQHNGVGGLANGDDIEHHTAGATQMNATYTLNSKTTACSACHSNKLNTEHLRTTSSLTGAGSDTCTRCHNDSTVTSDTVHASWPSSNTAGAVGGCGVCHVSTDGAAAATAHGFATTNHTAASLAGCTNQGAGCHGATPQDLTTTHRTGCALTRACHSATVYNAGVKSCTAAQCHPSGYNTTTFVHNSVDGSADATHQVTVGMGTTVGANGSVTAACTVCHSSYLKQAHDVTKATASITSTTGVTSWTNECTGCHNTTAPLNVWNLVVAANWTHGCTGNSCHTVGQAVHVDGGAADASVVTGTMNVACTTGGCHATADLHALHKDTSNPAGCALSDANGGCHTAANIDKLPTKKDCGGAGGCHAGFASGTHGVSSGTKPCGQCHGSGDAMRLDKMANDATTYHHVLDYTGTNTWENAPGTGTYPTDENALACVSCHADHNAFNSNPGANLRKSINDPNSGSSTAATNTDFIPGNGAAGNYDDGLCLGCHYAAITKNVSLQKNATGAGLGGTAQTPAMSASGYDASAHDYKYTAQFTKNSSKFEANCSKCHDDNVDTLKTFQNSANKIGTHYSAESRLLEILGAANQGATNVSRSSACYQCHITAAASGTDAKTVAGRDGYGQQTMSAKAESIYTEFQKVNRHPVGANPAAHQPNEGAASGWNPASNRHVECEDCHDVHKAKAGVTTWGTEASPRGSSVPIAGANEGVWGVTFASGMSGANWAGSGTATGTPTAPTASSYAKVAASTYQWQLCLKCHSAYAWGTTAPGVSKNNAGQTGGKQTDVGADFNPKNYAVHPIFSAGKNQPATNANTNWSSSAGRRAGTLGLGHTMTDGWTTSSKVVCTDCHNNNDRTGASGPHGSNNSWILSGVDTNVKVTPNGGSATYPNQAAGTSATNYCLNCHRQDVYGPGTAGVGCGSPAYANLSRFNHGALNSGCGDPTGADGMNATLQYSGCLTCHGARKDQSSYNNPSNATVQSGAIHGTSMTSIDGTLDPMGKRFMNGAAWSKHTLGTTSPGCYCIGSTNSADNYSACNNHTNKTANGSLYYNYTATN